MKWFVRLFFANKLEWENLFIFFIFLLENLQRFTMNNAPEKAAESLSNFKKTLHI